MTWLLAVDAGNTTIRLGAVREGAVVARVRLPAAVPETPTLLEQSLQRLAERLGQAPQAVGLSCVTPDRLADLHRALGALEVPVVEVGPAATAGLAIHYQPPEALGPDRIANAVAARDRFGAPCLAIDAGTALSLDVVGSDGAFKGGALFPGMSAASSALAASTARVPLGGNLRPRTVIGASTREGIAAGLGYGYPALIEGLLASIRRELGLPAPAVLTGGAVRHLADWPQGVAVHDPHLTLKGAAAIALAELREKSRPSGA
jgi:type III pantothenate kinase